MNSRNKETTNLHLYVQDHDLSAGSEVGNRHLARAIAVASELGMLDELALLNHLLKFLHLDVVVVDAGLLSRSWVASRV